MGEKSKLITLYIASIVKKYLPKNEEIIHSSLFLISNKKNRLNIPDWYHNGYSVISETVSSYLQTLCMEKALKFTTDGKYLFSENQEAIPIEDFENVVSDVDQIFSECDSGVKILNEANREFKLQHIGSAVQ